LFSISCRAPQLGQRVIGIAVRLPGDRCSGSTQICDTFGGKASRGSARSGRLPPRVVAKGSSVMVNQR
jgi:hypothetical protein